jgi:hypothetical protein
VRWLAVEIVLALAFMIQDEVKFVRTPGQNEALAIALEDLNGFPAADWPHLRYVEVEDAKMAQALSLALNDVSRSSRIFRPPVLTRKTKEGQGGAMVARVDLRWYWPKPVDLKAAVRIWEDFQFDPRYSVLVTKGTLAAFTAAYPDWQGKGWAVRWRKVWAPGPVVRQGVTYPEGAYYWDYSSKFEELTLADLGDVELLRLLPRPLNLIEWTELSDKAYTRAPLVSAPYLMSRIGTQIQDKGLFETLYSGRYYALAGFKKNTSKDATDEDVLFETLGIGNVKEGVTAKKVFDRLRSDKRVAVFRSGVTGRPRRADVFRSLAGGVDETTGLVSFTHDLGQDKIDSDTHPIANLLDFKDDGREGIFELPNGLHGYVAVNAKGGLVDEVPNTIANDRTIPDPHPPRLQAAESCKACHEAEGSDGWKRLDNDVKKMMDFSSGGKRLDIFGDLKGGLGNPDVLDRLFGLYSGSPERALQRGRDDFAAAVLKATGPWEDAKNAQADVVKHAVAHQMKVQRDYRYNLVTPREALRSLNVKCEEKDAPALFSKVFAREGPMDFRLAALVAGVPISRQDWDLVYGFAWDQSQTLGVKK